MILYFDASALVKKYVEEAESELVRKWLLEGPAATSYLSEVEIASALARYCREGKISEDEREEALKALRQDIQALETVELSTQVISLAHDLLRGHPLRAGDAIQLASCLFLRDQGLDVGFVAFDKKLNEAAKASGLELETHRARITRIMNQAGLRKL